MENKEFRMYMVVALIFMMLFIACMDAINDTNDVIDDMNTRVDKMLLEMNEMKQQFSSDIDILSINQEDMSNIRDWQITDVNEKIVLVEEDVNKKLHAISSQRIILSDKEIEIMWKLVHAEGGITSLECQKVIASAIINRILDDRWGDNIVDVMTEKKQFSVMTDGSYNKTNLEDISDTTKFAVSLALYEDYGNGAHSFAVEEYSVPKNWEWMANNMEIVMEIDNVTFFK